MGAPVVIIGAGGFGRELRDWLIDALGAEKTVNPDPPEFAGFLDDGHPDLARIGRIGATHPGGVDWLADHPDASYYIGVGDPATRATIAERCEAIGVKAGPAIVHPSAVVGSDVTLGAGTVVCPMTVITTDIRIGQHVHLNLTTTVGHDCVIGDFVTVNPGATVSGDVTIGDRVMIGTGASINQGLSIGPGAVVGAGAAVVKDVPAGTVVVGVPAKPRG